MGTKTKTNRHTRHHKGLLHGVSSRTKPVLKLNKVQYAYANNNLALNNINAKISLNSRVAIVGANGAGKTTLLNVLVGETNPTSGSLYKHEHLRISYIAQHSMHHLKQHMNISPLNYIQERFRFEGKDDEVMNRDTVKLSSDENKQQNIIQMEKEYEMICSEQVKQAVTLFRRIFPKIQKLISPLIDAAFHLQQSHADVNLRETETSAYGIW